MLLCGTLFSGISINIIFLNVIICGSTIWLTIPSIWLTHNLILTYERNYLHYLQEYCLLFRFIQSWEVKVQLLANGVVTQVWRTVEQKHKITEAVTRFGRDLWMSSAPPSPLKQCHLHLLARIMSKSFLNISKYGDSTIFLGKLFQRWVSFIVEKCSLIFRGTSCLSAHCLLFHSTPSTIPAFFFASKASELEIWVGISGLVAHPKASECYSPRTHVPTWNCALNWGAVW